MQKEWTEKEIEFLLTNYEKMSYKNIGKELKRSQSSVENKAHKIGVKQNKKYHFNSEFFKPPLNERSAYWIGFIAADGFVSEDGKELSIELIKSDDMHLKKFNKDLRGNIPVFYKTKKPRYIKGKYTGESEICKIRVYNKLLVSDLNFLGIFPRKSLSIKFQNLKNDLLTWSYIRGFFDGDGTLYYDKRSNQLRCKVSCSSPDFREEFQVFVNKLGIKTYEDDGGVGITGKECTRMFLSNIYDNATIYLDRKYKKYQNYKYLFGFNKQ